MAISLNPVLTNGAVAEMPSRFEAVSMRLRHGVASFFLRLGMTLGKQTDERKVRDLLRRMHPKIAGRPLVRVGGANDGGYLLADDFDGITACFSPGVGALANFEADLIKRGIPCFLADASVPAAPITHELVTFEKKYIGVINSVNVMTMDDWIGRYAPGEGDLLLQMDIEGAEWPVLLNMPAPTLRRFRMIAIEVHDMDRLIDRVGFSLIGSVLDRLLADFDVVHIHPNNNGGFVAKGDLVLPRVMEVTFLRKNRAGTTEYCTQFPHPLDMPNVAALPDIVLPRIWHH